MANREGLATPNISYYMQFQTYPHLPNPHPMITWMCLWIIFQWTYLWSHRDSNPEPRIKSPLVWPLAYGTKFMEFVISPTQCQLRYSFQTWILQFHLWERWDSNSLTAKTNTDICWRGLVLQTSSVTLPYFKEQMFVCFNEIKYSIKISKFKNLNKKKIRKILFWILRITVLFCILCEKFFLIHLLHIHIIRRVPNSYLIVHSFYYHYMYTVFSYVLLY